jgi:hypothetical protein
MRDSIRHCISKEDCSLFGYKRYSNVLIEIFFRNPLEMSRGSFRLRAGSNSPTWLKPVAFLPLFGSITCRRSRERLHPGDVCLAHFPLRDHHRENHWFQYDQSLPVGGGPRCRIDSAHSARWYVADSITCLPLLPYSLFDTVPARRRACSITRIAWSRKVQKKVA